MYAEKNLGRKRICSFVTLVTMDGKALAFYKNHGYRGESVREGFEKDLKNVYTQKKPIMRYAS